MPKLEDIKAKQLGAVVTQCNVVAKVGLKWNAVRYAAGIAAFACFLFGIAIGLLWGVFGFALAIVLWIAAALAFNTVDQIIGRRLEYEQTKEVKKLCFLVLFSNNHSQLLTENEWIEILERGPGK